MPEDNVDVPLFTPDKWLDLQESIENLETGGTGGGETVVVLQNDFTNSTTSITNSPLSFTPEPNKLYIWEVHLVLETDTATTGVRPGITEPSSGVEFYVGNGFVPNTQTTNAVKSFGDSTSTSVNSTGYSYANEPFYGKIEGMLKTGSSPVGDLVVTLGSEIDSSEVKILAGSVLIYKEVV